MPSSGLYTHVQDQETCSNNRAVACVDSKGCDSTHKTFVSSESQLRERRWHHAPPPAKELWAVGSFLERGVLLALRVWLR